MNIVCWGKFSWHRDRETSNQAHKPNKTERQTPRNRAGTKAAALYEYNICAVPACWLASRVGQMDRQMDSQTARRSGRKQKLRFVSATSKGAGRVRERAPFRPIFCNQVLAGPCVVSGTPLSLLFFFLPFSPPHTVQNAPNPNQKKINNSFLHTLHSTSTSTHAHLTSNPLTLSKNPESPI